MKKFLIFSLLTASLFSFSACGTKKLNLNDYLIEERNNLFVANDNLYSATLSTGLREQNYNFDGVINEKVEFGILTLSRNDNLPLANDTYTYVVTINENNYTGFLQQNPNDNSYSTDLEVSVKNDDVISVQVSFTGYTFNQTLTNLSSEFQVDKQTAINIANKEIGDEVKNILKNAKIEVVMKLIKDQSNQENKTYYWYVGTISTNGDTVGVLINANSGEVVAKKV